ncbi:HAMP domain-containing histidine kinase [bacterium]|nr:HAMP domain-containing histidine kinase [bacterium]
MVLYVIWLVTTALAVFYSWWSYNFLRKRDAYQHSLLAIQEAPLVTDDFESQADLLCQACIEETSASGCVIFLHHGAEEGELKLASAAGLGIGSTDVGGTELAQVVKDLAYQCWSTGEMIKHSVKGFHFLFLPIWHGHGDGGVMYFNWDKGLSGPDLLEISLLRSASSVAALLAPRFGREGSLEKAHEEIQMLRGEIAQESHLAGVGRLAAGVVHELSQPLTAVLTVVGSLSRTLVDPTSARRLAIIQDAVQKCKNIVEKLLVYSKASMEQERNVSFSRFVRAYTDMNQVVMQSLELSRELLNSDNIETKLNCVNLPPVRANSTQWSQAIANLLNFFRDCLIVGKIANPHIYIETLTVDKFIKIKFTTNSTLISKEELPRLFEPFFGNAYPDLVSCPGLALVREVVHKHDGCVEARASEEGMTVVISLPVGETE